MREQEFLPLRESGDKGTLRRVRPGGREKKLKTTSMPGLGRRLEELYRRYNRREFVHPDPLEFLYRYDDPADREIAGLIASSLAYGRVKGILASVGAVLDRMRPPLRFLKGASSAKLRRTFCGFRHRFTTGADLAAMLLGLKRALGRWGSLRECFAAGLRPRDETLIPALCAFVDELARGAGPPRRFLLPSPAKGSACKRLNLFLRWMVRRDEVDVGGWENVPASKLVVPLDAHMHRIALGLGFTRRRQANMRAALEVTKAFAELAPEDPARYDFALTRLGIRADGDIAGFLRRCGVRGHSLKEE